MWKCLVLLLMETGFIQKETKFLRLYGDGVLQCASLEHLHGSTANHYIQCEVRIPYVYYS